MKEGKNDRSMDNKVFYIDTKDTTYAFYINEIGYLEHLCRIKIVIL